MSMQSSSPNIRHMLVILCTYNDIRHTSRLFYKTSWVNKGQMWNIFVVSIFNVLITHLIQGSLAQITWKNKLIWGSLTWHCSWRTTGVKNSIWRKAQISTTFYKHAKNNKNEHQPVNHQYLQATKTGQRLLIIRRHGNTYTCLLFL